MDIDAALAALYAIKDSTASGDKRFRLAIEAIEALIHGPSWKQVRHDEVMRMQALAIGARLAIYAAKTGDIGFPKDELVLGYAALAYHEATGRDWQ